MKSLYDRLKAHGLDRSYVRAAILPDWWDDSLFEDASNRLTAHMSLARFLGVRVQQVADPSATLAPTLPNVRLKRGRNMVVPEVTGSITAALHIARIAADLVKGMPAFTGPQPAAEIRAKLLARRGYRWPELQNILDYCWEVGIAVIHMTRLPAGARKIAGLATFVSDRPVIVLCSGQESPAWLAFHLAHELGHIMRGHVRAGGETLVDVSLDAADEEGLETEADRYAIELLTGAPSLVISAASSLNAHALAKAAHDYGSNHGINPSSVALIYGYSQRRLNVAQAALRLMNEQTGASLILAEAFRRHVHLEEVSDVAARALRTSTQVVQDNPNRLK